MKSVSDRHSAPDSSIGGLLRCVWMLGGVVDYKLCDREYDCEHCPFDRALGEAGSSQLPRPKDKHSIFDDWLAPPKGGLAKELLEVQGYMWLGTLFYHPRHVWARIEEGGEVRIGLDDFGQKLVGRVYSVKLPQPGEQVIEGCACWGLVHRIGETSLAAPVAGTVAEINGKLLQLPSLINHDPYGQGWAMLIQPESLVPALKGLYYGQKSERWFVGEVERLLRELSGVVEGLEPDIGATLQDGGKLVQDLTRAGDTARARKVIDHFLSVSSSAQREVDKGRD